MSGSELVHKFIGEGAGLVLRALPAGKGTGTGDCLHR